MALKKIVAVSALGLATVSLLAACANDKNANSDKKEKVNFATVGTTAPFSYQKDGKLTGYDIEVAKAVFKDSEDYKVNFKKTEWSSIFTGLDASKFQMGANNISYTKERANKYLFSYPTGTTPSVLVVPKDSNIKSYADIKGHSTQVVQGTTTAAQLEDYKKKEGDKSLNLKYTNENITQILSNLSQGKADFKIFDAPTVNSIIKEQGLDNLKTIPLESKDQPYIYFIFGQDQEELQSFVNKRLKTLEKDGTLTKLAKEYLGGSYAPQQDQIKLPK